MDPLNSKLERGGARQTYRPSELPEHLKKAIAEARMDPRHDHLNALLDEK